MVAALLGAIFNRFTEGLDYSACASLWTDAEARLRW